MSDDTQLTREERYQLYALNAAGQNQTEIAQIVGRHKTTVSREIPTVIFERQWRCRSLTWEQATLQQPIDHELDR